MHTLWIDKKLVVFLPTVKSLLRCVRARAHDAKLVGMHNVILRNNLHWHFHNFYMKQRWRRLQMRQNLKSINWLSNISWHICFSVQYRERFRYEPFEEQHPTGYYNRFSNPVHDWSPILQSRLLSVVLEIQQKKSVLKEVTTCFICR